MTIQHHAEPAAPVPSGDALPSGDARPPSVGARIPERASPVRVILLGLALLGLLGAFGYLVMPRGGEVPQEPLEAELFEGVPDALPFGLQAAGARRLPAREHVLTYVARGGAALEPVASDPTELTVVEYPAARAERVLSDQFKKLRFGSGEGGGRGRPGGGSGGSRGGGGAGRGGPPGRGGSGSSTEQPPALQDAGYMDWHGYRANYARLRHSLPKPKGEAQGAVGDPPDGTTPGPEDGAAAGGEKKPGPFYETIRVNLSTGGRCLIAYVRFPDNSVGSKDAAETIMASFRPRPER